MRPAAAGARRSSTSPASMAIHSATSAAAALVRQALIACASTSLREQHRRRRRRQHAVAGALADPLPRRPVVPGELLEPERTAEAGSAVRRPQRGLDDDRAAAAHRIEQRRARLPAGQCQQAGGEVLAQRRRVGVAPVAALEQRLARGVEVERGLAVGEVGVDADVGALLVDRRPRAAGVAEAVADGVLDLQRRELEALPAASAWRRGRRAASARHRSAPASRRPSPDGRDRLRCDSGRARPARGCGSPAGTRGWRAARARADPRTRRRPRPRRRTARPSAPSSAASALRGRAGTGRRSGRVVAVIGVLRGYPAKRRRASACARLTRCSSVHAPGSTGGRPCHMPVIAAVRRGSRPWKK